MRTYLRCSPAIALLLLFADPVGAQRVESPYRFVETRHALSVWAGYFETEAGALNLGPESAPGVGVRYDIRVSGPFNFEAGLAALPTTRAVMDTVPLDTGFVRVADSEFLLGLAEVALRFDLTGPRTWHGLSPFVLTGAGLTMHLGEDDEANEAVDPSLRFDPGTSFAGQIGVGIEWFPARHLSVRLDARDYLWRLETPRGFLVRDPQKPGKQWVQNFHLSLGLAYRF